MSKLKLLMFLAPRFLRIGDRSPIRALVWVGLSIAALVATLCAWLASLVVDLAAGWVGGGELHSAGQAVTKLPVPEWLALWIDPAWVRAAQSLAQQLLQFSGDALPLLGQGIGLLNWVIWGLWGLVMVVLLVAGLKVHWLVGDSQRAVTRHSAPSAKSVRR